ncbi:hypothetical protein [Saccharopolyspora spinosa]|uniref:hypothetical protein n=1 Tax=Saccharopolyspora spinosa TaxID=60894 RepID=UPI000C6F1A21|nr:hypothetical protein [Saccharopolyspora spinosa]
MVALTPSLLASKFSGRRAARTFRSPIPRGEANEVRSSCSRAASAAVIAAATAQALAPQASGGGTQATAERLDTHRDTPENIGTALFDTGYFSEDNLRGQPARTTCEDNLRGQPARTTSPIPGRTG